MSAQRARSAVGAGDRSIHPNIPGVPWWAALVIAVTTTGVGYAIDAGMGHKELTHAFAVFYIAGCVAAVLAVRQDGVFTAIIQPPLILFCAVPGAYWMFHGRKIGHLKDLLINCGYPLIERFPLMLGVAGAVLLIGLVRWYFGASQRTTVAAGSAEDGAATGAPAFVSAIGAKLNSLLGFASHDDDPDEAPPKRTRSAERSKAGSRTDRAARNGRSAAGTGRTHSRRARPPLDDEHPRRRRQARPSDFDTADPQPRPRRPRPHDDSDPRDARREPRSRRNPYDRPYDGPSSGGSRFDTYDPPHEPRRRRAAAGNGAGTTHHPISQVRYRRLDEPARETRGRSRAPRGFTAEPWEYDG